MNLRRGDLVTVAADGPYTGKPRPALVIQAVETLAIRDSVTVRLLAAELIDAPLFRSTRRRRRSCARWGRWALKSSASTRTSRCAGRIPMPR